MIQIDGLSLHPNLNNEYEIFIHLYSGRPRRAFGSKSEVRWLRLYNKYVDIQENLSHSMEKGFFYDARNKS